jgi:trans-2-enoyl-CoA reductase
MIHSLTGLELQVVTASVRRNGQVFVYGVLESGIASVGINDLFREVRVTGWILSNKWDDKKLREGLIKRALTYLEGKVFEPLVGEKFDLANFDEAIKRSEEVGRGGKVLLTSAPR